MDPQQPDNGSQRTLPSQNVEMISNLSTRPNISEQNDPIFEDEPNQQRALDMHTDRQNNYPIFSQRIANHRSQSFDQGNNPLPIHFSAPPHLNQHRLQQQGRENMPILNNASSEKVFQLTTFDEDWERNLKEEEEIREKDYENHVLLNQENEPLLSQRHEIDQYDVINHHDIIYSDNEPLLSQTNASDQPFQLQIDNDPLLTQKSEPPYELNSIHQANQEAKSQASASNQIKYAQYQLIHENAIQDSGRKSHHSSSAQEFPQQPLFQIEFKDDTQSNLLKFGFTVKKKEDSFNDESRNLQVHHQSQEPQFHKVQSNQNNSNHFMQEEEPMQIQQGSYYIAPGYIQEPKIFETLPHHREQQAQYQSESQHKGEQANYCSEPENKEEKYNQLPYPRPQSQIQPQSQTKLQQAPQPESKSSQQQFNPLAQDDQKITIQVSDCHSENLNSASKNNDIYGITNQQVHHSIPNTDQDWDKNEPKIEQIEQQQNNNEPSRQVEWINQEGNSVKIDQLEEQCKEQVQNIPQQPLYSKSSQKQVLQVELNNQPLQQERPLTLDEIKDQMEQIANGEGQGVSHTERGVKLLKQHIDFLFILPLSDIGRQIMADGKTVVNLIKIILLKELDDSLKDILRKYLVLTLASKVSRNQQDLIDYQQATSVRKPHSASIENIIQNKSLQVIINQPVIHIDAASNEPNNHSVQAENGSSSKKSLNGKMEIDGQRQPIKRTLRSKNLVVETEKPSLRSGKVTRKTKYKSKGKGKTTTKKNTVKFDEVSNESLITATNEQPNSLINEQLNAIKRGHKTIQRIVTDSMKKGLPVETYNENLGTKFTFVLRENNRSHEKELVQRRVSQRLAKGSITKQAQQLATNIEQEQRRASLRSHSSKKKQKYEQEELDVDYIKQHLRFIKIKHFAMERDYGALTPLDQTIVHLLEQSDAIQDEESRERSTQHNEDYGNEPEDNTVSVRSQTVTNSMIRREEFKKNLSKYKVSEIPIVILRIVDPDINNHGIYALLELGKLSQMVYNARFALIPITNLSRASKRLIDEDLAEAKRQVGNNEKDNLVYMQPTATILDLIKVEKEKKEARQ